MKHVKFAAAVLLSVAFGSCEDDTAIAEMAAPNAGSLTGGPYSFTIDGQPDMIEEISLESAALSGSFFTFVITDEQKQILGTPPDLNALRQVDFDGAGEGSCYIYHLAYEEGLNGLEMGGNIDNLMGDFDVSNFLVVNRGGLNAGNLVGGPYEFIVDGAPDMVTDLQLEADLLNGDTQTFVITDGDGGILGLPPNLEAVLGVDFDGAGTGTCFIYHLTYSGTIMGLEPGMALDGLDGNFDLSNAITVNREGLNAGVLSGGPYTFVVDGKADMVVDLSFDGMDVNGMNNGFVITDADLNILGLPPTLEAVKGVDFDAAGAGVCLIWHLSYQDGLEGLTVGANAGALEGNFALSNSVTVTRMALDAGVISGGPFSFVIDGIADKVSNITLDEENLNGMETTWVVTDEADNILGVPPSLEAVKGIDFDGAGEGSCFIWHVTYTGELTGLMQGNSIADIQGHFDISNSIEVVRNPLNAGELQGGPYMFNVDGNPDMVTGISLDDTALNGAIQTYVITDDKGNILGLPPSLAAVKGIDFDGAGVGVCLIWHLTYSEGLQGLEMGKNVAEIEGFHAFSNSVQVTRMAMGD